MNEVVDLNEYRNKKLRCPVCGDGQDEPCYAECFGIETDDD